MNNKRKILLFGHGSYLNKGCEAIVLNTARVIKENSKKNLVTVATFDFENDKNFYPDLISSYLKHKWASSISENKCIFKNDYEKEEFSHNDVIKSIDANDIFFSVGGDNYCYGVSKWLYVIDEKIRNKNKKLVLWCASVNEDSVDDEFISDIRKFDVVLVRESLTYRILSKFVDGERLLLGPDIAFSLDPKEVAVNNFFKSKEGVIGLNLSPLILGFERGKDSLFNSFILLINHILKEYDYKIALIPHVYLKENNDLDVLRELKNYYLNEDRIFVLDDRIYDCRELKYIISKCKFLIAARTHASIAGYSSLVPTLVIGYSIKSKGIAKDIFGSYDEYVLSMQESISGTKIIDSFIFIEENEQKIRNILAQKMPIFRKEANALFERVLSKIKELDEGNITRKEGCSGCGACANICPVNAISMIVDSEGFLCPAIDKSKCTGCGLCRKICPNNNVYKHSYDKLKVFACINNNKEERLSSSSGGVFSLLSKNILKKGGCVFGAAYENYDVKHIKIENEDGLVRLRGSKYVESTIGNCFIDVKKELESGRKVLFSGVPCQIEGLKKFLMKEYDNLCCISVICHGVPSKKVFLEHLKELEDFYQDKIIKINFRNKDDGWENYKIEYVF